MMRYTSLSDDELLQHLQQGDEKAFTEVYNKYWQKLLAIGYYYTHNKQEAEDIVHEVMMRLWWRKNEVVINSLEAYLATAIKFSVFRSIARSKKQKEILAGNHNEKVFADIDEQLDARFQEAFINGEIEKLPPKAKLVFTYRRKEALTIKEIAGKMDLSPKAVEYHMTKALKSLKEALKKIKLFLI